LEETVVHNGIALQHILVSRLAGGIHAKIAGFGRAEQMPAIACPELPPRAMPSASLYPYAAPEVLDGEPVGAGIDVFAFGVLMTELLNGSPYTARSSLLARPRFHPMESKAAQDAAKALASPTGKLIKTEVPAVGGLPAVRVPIAELDRRAPELRAIQSGALRYLAARCIAAIPGERVTAPEALR